MTGGGSHGGRGGAERGLSPEATEALWLLGELRRSAQSEEAARCGLAGLDDAEESAFRALLDAKKPGAWVLAELAFGGRGGTELSRPRPLGLAVLLAVVAYTLRLSL